MSRPDDDRIGHAETAISMTINAPVPAGLSWPPAATLRGANGPGRGMVQRVALAITAPLARLALDEPC